MNPMQRTVLRVVVSGVVLVWLFYQFQHNGVFAKGNAQFFGIGLVAMGGLSFFIRRMIDNKVPDLQETLTPVFGYGLPKRGQIAVSCAIVALGIVLIVWSQWF
jgi:hypothetical protein